MRAFSAELLTRKVRACLQGERKQDSDPWRHCFSLTAGCPLAHKSQFSWRLDFTGSWLVLSVLDEAFRCSWLLSLSGRIFLIPLIWTIREPSLQRPLLVVLPHLRFFLWCFRPRPAAALGIRQRQQPLREGTDLVWAWEAASIRQLRKAALTSFLQTKLHWGCHLGVHSPEALTGKQQNSRRMKAG